MKREVNQIFPSDLYGRIGLGLASLVLGPGMWYMSFALLLRAQPKHALGWLFLLLLVELLFAGALFFTCGLIWALATPRWLEKLLESVIKKLAMAFIMFMVPFGILAVWALRFGGGM